VLRRLFWYESDECLRDAAEKPKFIDKDHFMNRRGRFMRLSAVKPMTRLIEAGVS